MFTRRTEWAGMALVPLLRSSRHCSSPPPTPRLLASSCTERSDGVQRYTDSSHESRISNEVISHLSLSPRLARSALSAAGTGSSSSDDSPLSSSSSSMKSSVDEPTGIYLAWFS